jgi:hypothetical protein
VVSLLQRSASPSPDTVCRLEAGITEQLFVAGSNILLRCGVKNNTKRHLSGLKVYIARRLIVSGPPGAPARMDAPAPHITEILHEQSFNGAGYQFGPGEELVTNVLVDLPRELRSVRKTRLFEVQPIAIVEAQLGSFAKPLQVEIPFFVAHAASLRRAPAPTLDALHPHPHGHAPPPRSHSSAGHHGAHHGAHAALPHRARPHHQHAAAPPSPSLAALEAYGAERGWSPAPWGGAPPSRPASAGGFVQLPASPLPFAVDPSAHQLQWDPQAHGWGASAFVVPQMPRSASAAPNLAQQQQFFAVPPTAAFAPPQRSVSAAPTLAPQHLRTGTAGSTHLMQQQVQSRNVSAPGNLGSHGASEPAQLLLHTPQAAKPSPLVPSSPLAPEAPVEELAGLATIEEDSESAAGTVRSLRALGAAGSVSRRDVAKFEEMADEHEAREEMRSMGMVPEEEPSSPSPAQVASISHEAIVAKTLPGPPVPSGKESRSTARPRASDLFAKPAPSAPQPEPDLPTTLRNAAPPSESKVATSAASPARAGLAALETRLRSPAPDAPQMPVSPRLAPSPRAASERRSSGALRAAAATAAAAERERTAREAEDAKRREAEAAKSQREAAARKAQEEQARKSKAEAARLSRQLQEQEEKAAATEKQREEQRSALETAAKQQAPEDSAKALPAARSGSKVSLERSASHAKEANGERKAINPGEVRSLHRQAVSRVDGWLSGTPTASTRSGDDAAAKPAPSELLHHTLEKPKTPPQSYLFDSTPSAMPASRDAAREGLPATSKVAAGGMSSALSADLRALVDGAEVRAAPKPGTAILAHAASRRFSSGPPKCDETPAPTATSPASRRVSMPVPPPAAAPASESASVVQISVPLSVRKELLAADAAHAAGEGAVEKREAPPVRGGRVSSVASMWASIAEGSDGALLPMPPTLSAKPKARTPRAGAPALDFSSKTAAASAKGSAPAAAAQPPTAIAAPKALRPTPALKATSAPHFLNTTMPRPVFASSAAGAAASPTSPLSPVPAAANAALASPAAAARRIASAPAVHPQSAAALRPSRREISDRVAREAKVVQAQSEVQAAVQQLPLALPAEGNAMDARGTTRAIGKTKMNSLRSLWEQ